MGDILNQFGVANLLLMLLGAAVPFLLFLALCGVIRGVGDKVSASIDKLAEKGEGGNSVTSSTSFTSKPHPAREAELVNKVKEAVMNDIKVRIDQEIVRRFNEEQNGAARRSMDE